MNNIIQYFVQEGINNLRDRILSLVRNGEGISAIVAEIRKETDALG